MVVIPVKIRIFGGRGGRRIFEWKIPPPQFPAINRTIPISAADENFASAGERGGGRGGGKISKTFSFRA